MMVLWEEKQVNEKFLCESLCLKSNTLTPLLKKLEEKGYITKRKDKSDERNLLITPTEEGEKLQDRALYIPEAIARESHINEDEAAIIYQILYKILNAEKALNR